MAEALSSSNFQISDLLAKNMAANKKNTYVILYCLSFKIILCMFILCGITKLSSTQQKIVGVEAPPPTHGLSGACTRISLL